MAKDLLYLSRKMMKVARAIEDDINEFVKDVALSVDTEVIRNTPVDVGTARTNWIVRLGAGFQYVYRAYAPLPSKWRGARPTSHPGRSERGNMNAALAQARGVLARRKTDDTIYISNNLPYIGRLNRGHSRQSPAGFVQAGVQFGKRVAVARMKFKNLRRLM